MRAISFYLDDSGTRYPNRAPGKRPEHGHDWFALGGILVTQEDEVAARSLHIDFCREWKITYPLHSSEVRSQNERFLWLRELSDAEQKRFYESLYQLLRTAPVVGLACVIDRPGYNARYSELYNREPWLLCKTAFSVAVERAAKYAVAQGCRLRVHPERCNKREDGYLRGYYDDLRASGMPFAQDTSEKYAPLTPDLLRKTLYEFKLKNKTSPMSQLADLYLWPICMGGYNANNRPYKRLMEDGKLIECRLSPEDWPMLATKYSCFGAVERKNTKGPDDPGPSDAAAEATS